MSALEQNSPWYRSGVSVAYSGLSGVSHARAFLEANSHRSTYEILSRQVSTLRPCPCYTAPPSIVATDRHAAHSRAESEVDVYFGTGAFARLQHELAGGAWDEMGSKRTKRSVIHT